MAFTEAGRRGQTPREELIMTEDKIRKIAIRARMAATGEPYNVARRAVEDSRPLAAADPGITEDRDTAPVVSSPSAFISMTVPDTPVGRQLDWFLGAMADVPWSPEVIEAHFDPRFLAQIGPDVLNSVLAPLQAPSGGSLLGVPVQRPADDPVLLQVLATFGDIRRRVTIMVLNTG